MTNIEPTILEQLNEHCSCVTLDRELLIGFLANQLGDDAEEMLESPAWQQYFSSTSVFVPKRDLDKMQAIVRAIEEASMLSGYREQVMSWAPNTAQSDSKAAGVFMGYDFHLSEHGPQLIEINTNAGGAFLNAVLSRGQHQCCGETVSTEWADDFDEGVIDQFESEWLKKNGKGSPSTIAIVDDQPTEQYLYPEFKLARQLIQRNGIEAVILSPSDLHYENEVLYGNGKPIDMVYNRLVDFSLDDPSHKALRQAWLTGSVVITPNPLVHALFADKRNLSLLTDAVLLDRWGLSAGNIELLRLGVPRSVLVTSSNAASLWKERREWFFKPVAGHGSKGVYRGSKLTKGTYEQILTSDYIAQAYIPPSKRLVVVNGEKQFLKIDVRLYTYKGNVLIGAARLYEGQATNFRTPGGGFAPLLVMADKSSKNTC